MKNDLNFICCLIIGIYSTVLLILDVIEICRFKKGIRNKVDELEKRIK